MKKKYDKIMKENVNIFGDVTLASFNDSVQRSSFPSSLKNANTTVIESDRKVIDLKVTEVLRVTIDQSAYL